MKTKPVRIAMASLVAVMSLLGVAQVSSSGATAMNERIWCC